MMAAGLAGGASSASSPASLARQATRPLSQAFHFLRHMIGGNNGRFFWSSGAIVYDGNLDRLFQSPGGWASTRMAWLKRWPSTRTLPYVRATLSL